MNLQQLEYIIALDIHRNHVKAAEHCHVTQPTLSMMVKKLQDELDVKIFQKSQPLKPTPSGEIIISRARQILQEVKNLKEFIRTEKDSIEGEFRLGVIPTLAPYLLLMMMVGAGVANASIYWQSILQVKTPGIFAGWIFSISTMMGNLSLPLAYGLFGFWLKFNSLMILMDISGLSLVILNAVLFIGYRKESA